MGRKFDDVPVQRGSEDLTVQILIGGPDALREGGESELAFTVAEAAMTLEVTTSRLMQLVRERQILPCKVWKGMLLFRASDVKRFKDERRRAAR